MGFESKEPSKETRQETKGVYALLQTTFKGKEMTKTFKEIREGSKVGKILKIAKIVASSKDYEEDMSLAPKGKGREGAKKLYKASYEEDEMDEATAAQRRARMNAHLKKTMAKYRAASKAGIHPSRVNQRRTQMTVKKR